MVVYKVTNRVNGKIYVGITRKSIALRMAEHARGKYLLSKAMQKYGPDAFAIEQIDTAETWAELCQKERHWIAALSSTDPKGYNLAPGGDGGPLNLGRKFPEEHRRRIAAALIGNKINLGRTFTMSEEQKAKLSQARKGKPGKPHSEATKLKIGVASKRRGNGMLGHKRSEETKHKIAQSLMGNQRFLGRKHSKETLEKMSRAASERWSRRARRANADEVSSP